MGAIKAITFWIAPSAIAPATNHYDIQLEHQLGYDVVRIPIENIPAASASNTINYHYSNGLHITKHGRK